MKLKTLPLPAFTLILLLACPLAARAVNTASGTGIGGNDWFDSSIWSAGAAPMNGDFEDDVRLAANAFVHLNSGNASVHHRLHIGRGGPLGISSLLLIRGGTLTIAGGGALGGQNELGTGGGNRTGVLIVSGGVVDFQNLRVHLGQANGNRGFIEQTGGTVNYGDQLRVGVSGGGAVLLDDGVSTMNGEVQIGGNADGTGTLSLASPAAGPAGDGHDATLNNHLTVGLNGVGELVVDKGSLRHGAGVTDRDFRFGLNSTGIGTGIVNGGLIEAGRNIILGQTGRGVLKVSGGTVTSGLNTIVGNLAPGRGELHVSGGVVNVGDSLRTGAFGTGITTVSGGTVDAFTSILVGISAGSLGSMTVSGGHVRSGLAVTATNTTIASMGTGILEVTGGTVSHRREAGLAAGNVRVGGDSGGVGKIVVSGDGLLETNGSLLLGTTGTAVAVAAQGELVMTGGRVALERELQVASGRKGLGSVNISGGLIQTDILSIDGLDSVGGAVTIGQSGTAALIMSGGTIQTGVNSISEFRFGFLPGSVGVGELSGGLITANVFAVGKGSAVEFDAAAEGLTSDGTATGDTLPAVGVVTISGGTILVGAGFQVGQLDDSVGTLTMTGGFVDVTNDFRLGVSAVFTDGDGISSFNGSNPSRGFAAITGGTINASDFESAANGTGEAFIGGNAQVNLGDALHAASGSGTGTLHIGGNANISIGSFIAVAPGQDGNGGNGNLNVSDNATLTAAQSFNISTGTATTGVAKINGGRISVAKDLTIKSATAAAGALHQSGGTLVVDGDIDATNGAVHTFSGGVLTRSSAGNIDYDGTLTISSTATIRFDDDKTMSITGGFDATGGGIFDLTGVQLTLGDGEYFFLTLGDGTGALGGDDFTDNTSLDTTIDLVGLDPLTASRVTESAFELGLFNPLTDDVYALVHDQATDRIGLRWHLVPEPGRVVLLAMGVVAIVSRRRRSAGTVNR